jgi:hypothetical protein
MWKHETIGGKGLSSSSPVDKSNLVKSILTSNSLKLEGGFGDLQEAHK